MHAIDLGNCLPITNCLQAPDQPKMDDRAALGRLYPVTTANQVNFPTKSVFADTTARIHGVVSFPSGSLPGPGMQGVNVVARWVDPVTLLPSRTYVAASVSGNLYHGNIGNPLTGFLDASGQPFDRWGSDDPSVQGFYDLAGLEFPDGRTVASYAITVEPIDPLYSEAVGSYAPLQVWPSGASAITVVIVNAGSDTDQDLMMTGGAVATSNPLDSQDYLNPTAVPGSGEWRSWLASTGGTNYYSIPAQANRTLSVEVVTEDEESNVTENKAQPVIGMWSLAAPPGTPPPAVTPNPFNTGFLGLSRLDAQVLTATDFRIGVTDWRGDGRPDYAHRVRVLYADTISPARAGAEGGGAVQVQGIGFRPGMVAQVGGVAGPVASISSNQLVVLTPALADGLQTIVVSDPATGGFSTMSNVVTMGAGASDTLQLLPVANPAIPVGGTTPSPLQFIVVAPDGTPVAGATVSLSTSNGLQLDLCGGGSSCSVFSNESGRVVVNAVVTAIGTAQVTAQLAPVSYSNPSTVVATLTGIESNLDIALIGQMVAVEQGASVNVPLLARVLNNGTPQPGNTVNFQVAVGTGTLQAPSVATDGGGNAPDMLRLTPVSVDVQVTACVAPHNAPCKTFLISAIPVSALQVEAFNGTQQVVQAGQAVAPVMVRVTDNAVPPDSVFGARVTFVNVLARQSSGGAPATVGDVVIQPNPETVLLGSAKTVVISDSNGLAQIAPWASPVTAGEEVAGLATVDSGAQLEFQLQVLPGLGSVGTRVGPPAAPVRNFSVPNTDHAGNTFSGFPALWMDAGAGLTQVDGDVPAESSQTVLEMPIQQEENLADKKKPAEGVQPKKAGAVDQSVLNNELKKSNCERCSGMACSGNLVQ
jgi:IPT/TIG domain